MKLRKFSVLLISVCIGAALLSGCDKAPTRSGTEPSAVTGTNTLTSNTLPPMATDKDTGIPDNTDDNADSTNDPIDATQLYADMLKDFLEGEQ